MAWQQVKSFNPNLMGRRRGMCLQNCRLGFGIKSGKYASAKADMQAQRKSGTLHSINTLPGNVAVPVYVDTNSQYEHVLVYNRGAWWSDGVRVNGWRSVGFACFGWGELCDGTRVVRAVSTPATNGFFPKKGYWQRGDCDARIGRMASFMRNKFPAYTKPAALGNYYGPNLESAVREFQRRTGLQADGKVGPITFAKLKSFGFGG